MLWPALLVLGALGCLAVDEKPCALHNDGKYYDLSPLKASKDYEFQTPGGHLFVINVCKRPVRETFGLKDANNAEIGGFVRRDHGDFSIGALNTTLSVEESRPRITLTDGSLCKSKSGENHIRASTVVEFVCDTSVFGSGSPRLVAQLPPGNDDDACAFFIEWRTHVACPTNEPGGAWGFFAFLIALIISLALLYLVLGTLYNRFVLRLRGVDQIPQFSVEAMKYHVNEAVDWIKDVASGLSAGRGGGYSRMPAGAPAFPSEAGGGFTLGGSGSAGMNPVSHQTQVASATAGGNNEFVRPQAARTGSGTGRINPVSHQAQQTPTLSTSSVSPPPPPPAKKEKLRPKPFDLESTMQEREFMLGDDDDEEEGQDLGASKPTAPVPPPTAPQASEAGPGPGVSAAAFRGRDMGPEGVTRL
ncbi:hypothetical protein Hypma_003964 [Hypsizygus marmoreus]|uniref:Autophagy-related protein 27 n=1 Tax=Hypsizygus marmoreus TaxID=39966 RepID=A0A369J150_HYPMA|nr:hypothetical protein Hypma_003964 [Hypsizygus marmoreus]